MKTIIWKIRYAIELRKILRIPWRWCWNNAGSALESYAEISECPLEAARYERDEWAASAD